MGIIPQKKRKGKRKLCNISVHFGETGRTVTLPWETETWSVSPGTRAPLQHQVCGGVLHERRPRGAEGGRRTPGPRRCGPAVPPHPPPQTERRPAPPGEPPRLVQQLPGDGDQGSVVQWVEDKGGVQTVEELRGKDFSASASTSRSRAVRSPSGPGEKPRPGPRTKRWEPRLEVMTSTVLRKSVLRPRLSVSTPPPSPGQDGPDIPMGLLQLVQQHHGPGGAAHRPVSCPPSSWPT